MSAPPGSRGSRTSTRSRGSVRGGSRGRGVKNGTGQQQSSRAITSTSARSNSTQPYLKLPGQQNQIRGKSSNRTDQNGAQLSSAILSHAGTISKSKDQPWRNAAEQDSASYKQRMNDLYQTLKENRERERKRAIKDGFLADPDKPTSLANAITPVGTCLDMCPEFERVERIVQLMVDANEKIPSTSNAETKVPCEDLMVKRFRRSAAGYDEQLPSDIRPPAVLQKTLNHLFDSIIGGPEPLANKHKFVWDRTRGIRNDFSIQQVTKVEDLRIAIDCFERIARFHILSLHQLSHPDKDNGEFDHHQEREQLNNTLLSLIYYYDDSRHKLRSPNEAEFRAYCVIFEIQDQRPDLEDRAQTWPGTILKDTRVKTALNLYAAAGNTSDEQGPLRPRTPFSIAQANTRGFFELVQSNSVSYVTACVAEIYFNLVRSTALESIWKAYKGKRPGAAKVEDWLLEDLTYALGFDNHDQSRTFCEEHEFEILEREDGEEYLNLGSVIGPSLKDNNPRRKQMFSRYLVESKRRDRSFSAVINGLSVSDAQAQGLVDDSDADNASVANSESLFVNGDADDEKKMPGSRSSSPVLSASINAESVTKLNGAASPFNPATFGVLSSKPNPFKSVESTQSQPRSVPGLSSKTPTTAQVANPFAPRDSPKSNFSFSSNESQPQTSSTPGLLNSNLAPKFNVFPASDATKTKELKPETASSAAGEPNPANLGAFGAPSINGPADPFSLPESVLSQQPQAPTAPMFSFGTSQNTSNTGTIHTPTPNPIHDHTKTDTDTQSKAAEPPETGRPNFSFGTSTLFQSMANEAKNESQPSSSQPPKSNPPRPSSSNILSPKPPYYSPFTPTSPSTTSPFQSPTKTSDLLSKPSSNPLPNAPTPSVPPAFNSQASIAAASPNLSLSKESSQPSVTPPPMTFPSFPSIPVSKPQQPQTNGLASTPAILAASSTFSASARLPPEPIPSKTPPPDPRLAALDKVTDGLMFEEGGLVQQYIEMSVVPIMRSAIAQFEDEESWREAREYRVVLLAKKYFQRWKNNAWNLGLMRRGRDRRQSLARSMQSLARSTQQRQKEVSRSSLLDVISSREAKETATAKEIDSMPPPPPPPPPAVPKHKRQSLPIDSKAKMGGAVQTPKKSKRKLDDTDLTDQAETQQPRASSHKRSNTVSSTINGESIMSAPPHHHQRFRHRQSIDASRLGDGSLLSNNIMKQARRMIPEARSDTTQTDYFRLKALGINPDTPLVPLTNKRGMTSGEVHGAIHAPGKRLRADAETSSAIKQSTSGPAPKTRVSVPDEDNEFFASIRAIRSTLADSTSWFQSERESIERSMTPSQPSASPPSGRKETVVERRLREIKERGHTPSRSEIRLRAMGNKALLPEGFWDGEGMGRSLVGGKKANTKQKENEKVPERRHRQQQQQPASANNVMGFAALRVQPAAPGNHAVGFSAFVNQRPQTGMVNGFGLHSDIRDQSSQQSGATSEDVIELSD